MNVLSFLWLTFCAKRLWFKRRGSKLQFKISLDYFFIMLAQRRVCMLFRAPYRALPCIGTIRGLESYILGYVQQSFYEKKGSQVSCNFLLSNTHFCHCRPCQCRDMYTMIAVFICTLYFFVKVEVEWNEGCFQGSVGYRIHEEHEDLQYTLYTSLQYIIKSLHYWSCYNNISGLQLLTIKLPCSTRLCMII